MAERVGEAGDGHAHQVLQILTTTAQLTLERGIVASAQIGMGARMGADRHSRGEAFANLCRRHMLAGSEQAAGHV